MWRGFFIFFGGVFCVPENCLRIGSLQQTADARMFELPAEGNCGQYMDTGDVLCIGNSSLKIVRKWGLVVQLDGSHGAQEGGGFLIGNCEQEKRRLVMKIESISTAVSLVFDDFRQKISALLVSPETGEGRILSTSMAGVGGGISVFPVFAKASDFGVTRDGSFVVVDGGNHRVVEMIGNLLDVVAGNGVTTTAMSMEGGRKLSELKFPISVAVGTGKTPRRFDSLFVVDAGNFRVVRWRFAALRGEVVWESEISERSEIVGFGKIVIGNGKKSVKFVVKKKTGDEVVTLQGDSLVFPKEDISDTPTVLWTVDEGKVNNNIFLESEISRTKFPGVHDLVISANFASSRAVGKTWKLDEEISDHIGGFVALAEDANGGLFGINEDGVMWYNATLLRTKASRLRETDLIRDEL